MNKSYVSSPIVLGSYKIGEKRHKALLGWAEELGLTWNGKPSMSRLIQHLADIRIQAGSASVSALQRRIKELEGKLERGVE